ncbi:cu2+-exporting atpase [Diplodia corticola]|uniref:Cu2+-exporting atpase n=1 Tax=Diplodia corticola TaxID=236234 RepID=A0A1J9S320_9PEZI|nr:cu2+-exporting atpase [Diplodia corticola]OJD34029.1 cu2+-exporting atpase [Diplodia corticola]
MGRQYDNEDASSSTVVGSSISERSVVTRCRNILGWFAGRHPRYNDCHEHVGHDSHSGGHRWLRSPQEAHCCGVGMSGNGELSPIPIPTLIDSMDLGQGPLYQNIRLGVSGMTCSGCERALQKVLEKIPSAKDIHTDMATSQARFCIDINTISVDAALRHVRRATGYKIKQIDEANDESQFLDVLLKDPDRPFRGQTPRAVRSYRQTGTDNKGKTEVRIEFDPHSILPRDLMNKLAEASAELAPIPPPDSVSTGRRHLRRELMYFIIALTFTLPVLVLVWAPLHISDFNKEIACLFLATAVQISAWEFYPNAFKSLFHSKLADMDLLIILSTTTAYIFSVAAFARYETGDEPSDDSFFETSTLLVTLIRLGRYMAELARQKATESVSIRTLQAPTAQLLMKHRNETKDVDVRLLQRGDTVRVPPHTRIPTDGTVVYGGSQVDESMMTGESRPVAKGIDSDVTAGTMNLDGQLDIRVDRMAWENSISQIGALVDHTEMTKPKIQARADKVAGYFVPTIITLSITVFLVWILVGILVSKKSGKDAASTAASYAIATLIVSCPCAIGLAVPMVIIIASGVAAKHGVIFRAPAAIETAQDVTHIVVDKTGTLTEGKLSVIAEKFLCRPKTATLGCLFGLVSGQKHPVALAVADWIRAETSLEAIKFDNITAIVGGGLEGTLDEEKMVVRAGNCDWLRITSSEVFSFTHNLTSPPTPSTESPVYQHSLDYTIFGVTINDELCALFALRDVLRPETPAVISALQSRHISVSIVSGDDARNVSHCADILNIPASQALSRCSPTDKAAYVASLQKVNARDIVLFLGDGTNDAVALKQATIGMSIAGGTDVAKSAADIVLARPDLRGLLIALDVSRRAVRRVRFNFTWAAVYNLFAVLLAAGAFVSVKMSGGAAELAIPPAFAGLGEIVSILPVVLIAFSLRFAKFSRHGGEMGRMG